MFDFKNFQKSHLPFSELLLWFAVLPVLLVRSRHLRFLAERTLPDEEGNVGERASRRVEGAFRDPNVQAAFARTKLEFYPLAPILTGPVIDSRLHSRDDAAKFTGKLQQKWLRFTGRYLDELLYLTTAGRQKLQSSNESTDEQPHSELTTAYLNVPSLIITQLLQNIEAGREKFSNWELLSQPPEDPHLRYQENSPDGPSITVHAFIPYQRVWSTGEFHPRTIVEPFDMYSRAGSCYQLWLPEADRPTYSTIAHKSQ